MLPHISHGFLKKIQRIRYIADIYIYTLALKPSSAKITKSYTPAVYPHLNDFSKKLNFP